MLPSEEVPKYDLRSTVGSSPRNEVCFGQIQWEKRPNMTHVGQRQLTFISFNNISISNQFSIEFLRRSVMISYVILRTSSLEIKHPLWIS